MMVALYIRLGSPSQNESKVGYVKKLRVLNSMYP